jgi:cell division protein FtsB
MNTDIQLLIVGGLIAFVSSVLTAILVYFLQGRRLKKQWEHKDKIGAQEWEYDLLVREYDRLWAENKEKTSEIKELEAKKEKLTAVKKGLEEQLRNHLLGR